MLILQIFCWAWQNSQNCQNLMSTINTVKKFKNGQGDKQRYANLEVNPGVSDSIDPWHFYHLKNGAYLSIVSPAVSDYWVERDVRFVGDTAGDTMLKSPKFKWYKCHVPIVLLSDTPGLTSKEKYTKKTKWGSFLPYYNFSSSRICLQMQKWLKKKLRLLNEMGKVNFKNIKSIMKL